jgi:DNA-binding transcriptional MerR regulator
VTGTVPERAFLSIGEVLSLLRDEFADITISKIRFLESQGLVNPERTPSGYRKFYEADVERLRWILRQQRENFLPLKVIKGRLAGDGGDAIDEEAHGPGADDQTEEARRPVPAAAVIPPYRQHEHSPLSAGPSGISVTLEELSAATGSPIEKLTELEKFGFFAGRPVAGVVYYDEEAMVVASLAARFAAFGIEARHLRVYKNAAEREAGLFEQIVTPLLKQRNPQARGQAVEALSELSGMGQNLRAALVRQALRGVSGA